MSQDGMYLQNIEEYVFDEEKIVTYKWLSKMLNIHVNLSKHLLLSFYSEESRKGSVWATFFLAGRLRDNGNYHVTVVGEDTLEKVKPLFDSLSSEHIYSIQKHKVSPTWSTLFTADTQPTGINTDDISKLSSIHCSESVKRAAEEMARLRICPPNVAPPPPKETSSSSDKKNSPNQGETVKSTSANKVKAKPKGRIAAMFSAQTSKVPASKPQSSSSTSSSNVEKDGSVVEDNVKGKVEPKHKGSIAAMFSAQAATKPSSSTTSTSSSNSENKVELINKKNVKAANAVSKKEENKGSIATMLSAQSAKAKASSSKSSASSSKPEKNKNKRKEKQKEEPKKRKRIVVLESDSSSSEDDLFGGNENDNSREQSPETVLPVFEAKALESEDEDVIPPTPASSGVDGRIRRRRKIFKDKTYKDEDGYIVTEKVAEYESYSESDSESKEKSKKPKDSNQVSCDKILKSSEEKAEAKVAPKKVSPAKTKQQSLTSFFKRK